MVNEKKKFKGILSRIKNKIKMVFIRKIRRFVDWSRQSAL